MLSVLLLVGLAASVFVGFNIGGSSTGIAGLGLAHSTLDYETIGRIVSWWILVPVIGFFTGMIIGRHLYHRLERRY